MYLKYDRKTIKTFTDEYIEEMYNNGYVFGRIEKGQMDQTKSLRINLKNFSLTSENRRILRKTEDLNFNTVDLPLNSENYSWEIHKVGKDFYTNKFGDNTFSASKIKVLCTQEHNFNKLLEFSFEEYKKIGYCICLETENIFHYCYPFYNLEIDTRNIGMGMMLKAIIAANEAGKEFVYLGSVQRDSDKYKLQFKELELWNNLLKTWEPVEL